MSISGKRTPTFSKFSIRVTAQPNNYCWNAFRGIMAA